MQTVAICSNCKGHKLHNHSFNSFYLWKTTNTETTVKYTKRLKRSKCSEFILFLQLRHMLKNANLLIPSETNSFCEQNVLMQTHPTRANAWSGFTWWWGARGRLRTEQEREACVSKTERKLAAFMSCTFGSMYQIQSHGHKVKWIGITTSAQIKSGVMCDVCVLFLCKTPSPLGTSCA